MKWSLMELKKYQTLPLTFNETLDLKKALLARDDQILDVTPVVVNGQVTVSATDYFVDYTLETVLTLPSSRSLTPVEFPLELQVTELFMTEEQLQQRSEMIGDEEVLLIEGQTIDLTESVLDNILLAIPLQILTPEEKATDEMPKGNDWEVISEEAYLQRKQAAEPTIDPRLAKLSDLFGEESTDEP